MTIEQVFGYLFIFLIGWTIARSVPLKVLSHKRSIIGYHVDEVINGGYLPRPMEREFVVWVSGDVTSLVTADDVVHLPEIPQLNDVHPLDNKKIVVACHVIEYPSQYRILVIYKFIT